MATGATAATVLLCLKSVVALIGSAVVEAAAAALVTRMKQS